MPIVEGVHPRLEAARDRRREERRDEEEDVDRPQVADTVGAALGREPALVLGGTGDVDVLG